MAFLRPVANRVASKSPARRRPTGPARARRRRPSPPRSGAAAVTGAPPSSRRTRSRAGSGRSVTNVSSIAVTLLIRWPVMYCVRSMMCAPMSPSAPEPACSFCSRQTSGKSGRRSSPGGTARARAGSHRADPRHEPSGQRDRRDPAVGEPAPCADAAGRGPLGGRAISSASATVFASGFSQSTCLPASSAAMAISAWVSPACRCRRGRRRRARAARFQSVSVDSHPSRSRRPRRPRRLPTAQRGHLGAQRQVEESDAVRQATEWAAPMKA